MKHTLNANRSPVHLPPPDMTITTDASKKGWGAAHQSFQTNGRWSQKESLQHINYLEIKASFLALKTFLKGKSHVTVSLQLDNTTATAYINNKGDTRSPQVMTLALEMWDWCQERDILVIASHRTRTRQGVQRIHGHERVEVRPNNYSALPAELSDRSICESSNQSTRGLHQLETRPRSNPHRRLHNKLGYSTGLCLPSLQSDIEDPDKVNNRPNRTNSRCCSLASSALVAGSAETPDISASVAPEQSKPVNGPDRPEPRSSNVSLAVFYISTSVSKLRAFRQTLPIYSSQQLAPPHGKTYESSRNRWCRWCSRRQIDPLSSSLSDILIFLTEGFNEGLAYRSLNVLRSAISSTHPKLDGFSMGQHPYVTRLLKGALNKRLPKPRYSHTWNVDVMIKYMISLGKNRTLLLKVISMKLVTLLAITCPESISAFTSLDLRHCSVLSQGVCFKFTVPRKTGTLDKPAEACFACFDQDGKLCPVECF